MRLDVLSGWPSKGVLVPLTEELVPVTDVKARISELLRGLADRDVVVLRYGRPAGVLVRWEKYVEMVRELEALKTT